MGAQQGGRIEGERTRGRVSTRPHRPPPPGQSWGGDAGDGGRAEGVQAHGDDEFDKRRTGEREHRGRGFRAPRRQRCRDGASLASRANPQSKPHLVRRSHIRYTVCVPSSRARIGARLRTVPAIARRVTIIWVMQGCVVARAAGCHGGDQALPGARALSRACYVQRSVGLWVRAGGHGAPPGREGHGRNILGYGVVSKAAAAALQGGRDLGRRADCRLLPLSGAGRAALPASRMEPCCSATLAHPLASA